MLTSAVDPNAECDLALSSFGKLATDVCRSLVRAEPLRRRVPDLPVVGPLGELHFGHESRLDPGTGYMNPLIYSPQILVQWELTRVDLPTACPGGGNCWLGLTVSAP